MTEIEFKECEKCKRHYPVNQLVSTITGYICYKCAQKEIQK